MKYPRFCIIATLILSISCYKEEMMPIEVLDNHKVLCKQFKGYEHVGLTVKDESISLKGKVYKIPAGTVVDNRDFSGLIFPKETYFPVGENLIPFEKNEAVSILFDTAVYVMSGVLGHDITLKVGNMMVPFKAARNDPELKKYRGEYQMHFHRNGAIQEGYIDDKGFTVTLGRNQVTMPGGLEAQFYDDGTIEKVYLDSTTTFSVGENKIPFREEVSFYPSGNVRSGNIRDTVSLKVHDRNIAFCGTGGWSAFRYISEGGTISFHENGTVSEGLLADTTPFFLFGKTVKFEPQGVFFDSTGNLQILENENEILKYSTDIPMLMFDNDYFEYDTICPKLETDKLPDTLPDLMQAPFRLKIGGNSLLFSRKNPYRFNSTMRSAIVPDQTVKIGENTIRIWNLVPVNGTGILFYQNGSIKGVSLFENCFLKVWNRSILFLKKPHRGDKDRPDVDFYCDGKVARGYIGQEIEDSISELEPEYLVYKSKKVRLKPKQEVYFKRDGTVKYSINDLRYIIYEYKTDVYSPESPSYSPIDDTDKINQTVVDSGKDNSNCRRVVKVTANLSMQIYMDGLPVGETPVTVTNIPEGPHWFTVNSYEEILKDLKKKAGDYQQAKAIIESFEKTSGVGGDTTSFSTGEILPTYGYIRYNGQCNDTEQIHYSVDYSKNGMYFMFFNTNISKEIVKNKNPKDLTEIGWFRLKDMNDTLRFGKFTEQAKRLLDKEGTFNEDTYANYALSLFLRNDSLGAKKQYEEVLLKSRNKTETQKSIRKDLSMIENMFPNLEERICNFRKSLALQETE